MTLTSLSPKSAATVRPANPADAEAIASLRAEPFVQRHQPLRDMTVDEIRDELEELRHGDLRNGQGAGACWVVELGGEVVGAVKLTITSWQHGLAEIGCSISERFAGRGMMTEANRRVLDEVFDGRGIERVEAICSVENVAVQRLRERLGFTREGRLRSYFALRGRRYDAALYGLLRSDWAGSAAAVASPSPCPPAALGASTDPARGKLS